MPKRTQAKSERAHIDVQIEDFEASVEATINFDAYAPQYAWHIDDRDPVYEFTTRLEITGTIISPRSRAGHGFELTLYGDDAPSRFLHATLKDIEARGEYNEPQYRQYRGKRNPVYEPPKGMGSIDKVRGEDRWTAYLFVLPRFVSDALILLGGDQHLYLEITERKEGRTRRIQRLSLQTTDPGQGE